MLAFYNQYWCKTQTLISDDIKTIIWRQNLIFVNTPYPFCLVKDTYTTRHANDKLHYKFNCLKCFYFLLSKIIAGISNDKISMRI